MRSRALSFPSLCWRSRRSAPPPSSACAMRCRNSSSASCCFSGSFIALAFLRKSRSGSVPQRAVGSKGTVSRHDESNERIQRLDAGDTEEQNMRSELPHWLVGWEVSWNARPNCDRGVAEISVIDRGKLSTEVASVLPLEQARAAHEMLAGAPHERGKIVLSVA